MKAQQHMGAVAKALFSKSTPLPALIGLAGPAGVGKDTAADYLAGVYKYERYRLAERDRSGYQSQHQLQIGGLLPLERPCVEGPKHGLRCNVLFRRISMQSILDGPLGSGRGVIRTPQRMTPGAARYRIARSVFL